MGGAEEVKGIHHNVNNTFPWMAGPKLLQKPYFYVHSEKIFFKPRKGNRKENLHLFF